MHQTLFELPIVGVPISTYGFCLMVGFLTAVWFAMRRAERVKGSADVVLDMSFLALLFGVGGARVFYVVHHWHPQFTSASNKLFAVIDITQGGLEFLGGLIGAAVAIIIYSIRKKLSLRLYLDILAPGAMWGLAFGRVGCFFNGCCFGAVCGVPGAADATVNWSVRFPFASPAFVDQWKERRATLPAELILTGMDIPHPWPLPSKLLNTSVKKRELPVRQYDDAKEAYEEAKASGLDAAQLESLRKTVAKTKLARDKTVAKFAPLRQAQRMPSRQTPTRPTSVSEIQDLADTFRSWPVYPTQLYSSVHALLLSLFLSAIFYCRKRHGVVIAMLFVLYPIPRMVLEVIRVDNPLHAGGLTASQWVGMGMMVAGIATLMFIYKKLPERSPVLDAS